MSQSQTSSPILHGRYRIDAKLGVGRLAVVYRGHDERLQRPVLVHMLRQELVANEQLRQRFLQEAHASARRSHQSLLEVFDSGEVGQRPYMVTEYVAGRTLRELGALSLEEALLYFRQVVGAVAACQAAGVPHPPISSTNLVLVEDGHVELLENWQTPLDQVAADVACYRAPERTAGRPASDASAVYALGLLLYEMLVGQRLISGDDAVAVAHAHLGARIPPLGDARPLLHVPALEQLLVRATARRPEDRTSDAAALARELDELRRNLHSDTRKLAVPPVPMAALRGRRNRRASDRGAPVPPREVQAPPPRQPQPPQPPAAPMYPAAAPPFVATPPPLGAPPRRLRPRISGGMPQRSFGGIITLIVLFCVVGFGAYYVASVTADRLLDVQLPRPQISLPSIPSIPNVSDIVDLPEWLTGVVSGGGDILVVDGTVGGLNLRDAPSLTNSNIVAVLPNGARVRKVEGPQPADGVDWLHVRAKLDGAVVEGWLSDKFVKLEAGVAPASAP